MIMKSQVKENVKKHYSKIPQQEGNGCCESCGDQTLNVNEYGKDIGYSEEDLNSVPSGANLGLGCGNPLALEEIKPGDTVVDLGSGAGFDCFLAAQKVGPNGLVIGVDMTPEMIAKANENKEKVRTTNIDFRLGNIEELPVESDSVDMIISNCVINLSLEKPRVFREAFRVLKPGGVLAVSDIVLYRKLPWFIRKSVNAYVGCISGASTKDKYLEHIKAAGFEAIDIIQEHSVDKIFPEHDPTIQKLMRFIPLPRKTIRTLSGRYAGSIQIRASKPLTVTTNKLRHLKDKVELVSATA